MLKYLFFLVMFVMNDRLKSDTIVPFHHLHLVTNDHQLFSYDEFTKLQNLSINQVHFIGCYRNTTEHQHELMKCEHMNNDFEGVFDCKQNSSVVEKYYINFDKHRTLMIMPLGKFVLCSMFALIVIFLVTSSTVFLLVGVFEMLKSDQISEQQAQTTKESRKLKRFKKLLYQNEAKYIIFVTKLDKKQLYNCLEWAIQKNMLRVVQDLENAIKNLDPITESDSKLVKLAKMSFDASKIYLYFDEQKRNEIIRRLCYKQNYSVLNHLMKLHSFSSCFLDMNSIHPLFIAIKNKDALLLSTLFSHFFDAQCLNQLFIYFQQNFTILSFALSESDFDNTVDVQMIETLVSMGSKIHPEAHYDASVPYFLRKLINSK